MFWSYLRDENGSILVHTLIIAILLMIGVALANQVVLALWQEQSLYLKEKQAYYLAESGIEYAKAMLAENAHWRPATPLNYGGGKITIILSEDEITSYGTYGNLTRRVVWRNSGASTAVLGPIERALHLEKDINLGEDSDVMIAGDGYINGNLTIHKKARAYFYNLYLVGKVRVQEGGIFQISGKPHQGSSPELMLKPSLADFRKQAAQEILPADVGKNYDLGAGNLVLVNGDLDLDGLEVSGWGAIVVNGNLRLSGEVKASPGPVTLIVLGDCHLFGSSINGLLYVYGTVHPFKHWGTAQINGALWAEKIGGAGGDLRVVYDERLKSGLLWRNRGRSGTWFSD